MGNFFKYSKPPLHWVCESNRGNPVGGNATLAFGTDGNLVLVDADGRVAWQNKRVVGLKLLPNGKMNHPNPSQYEIINRGLLLALQGQHKPTSYNMASSTSTISLLSLFLFSLLAFVSQAQVPANETFKFVNDGEFGPYIIEYDGNYRMISVFNAPFQLGFYNTTPNAFTLALRMGLRRSESLFRWVWEANRGNPVGENATLTFGTDGNLVLAEADGRVAWQTNTANKGVVGFKLLPTGNMGIFLYYKSKNSPKPLLYSQVITIDKGSLDYATLKCTPDTDEGYAYDITLNYEAADSSS
ncbi:PREDICTED: epidermis-specific secreted, partial [Prunus dulcis]